MVRLVVPLAPGGFNDIIARYVAAGISGALGQPVVVENRAGAAGNVGSEITARAAPDGYTLLLATGGHAVAGALYNTLPYQTVASFEMVSTITYFPFLLVANAESRYRSFRDVMAAAAAAPGWAR